MFKRNKVQPINNKYFFLIMYTQYRTKSASSKLLVITVLVKRYQYSQIYFIV